MLRFLLSNFKTRLLALVLATVTWFAAWREMTETYTDIPVGIDIDQAGEGAIVTSVKDEEGHPVNFVTVRLTGPRGQRAALRGLRFVKAIERQPGGAVPPSMTFEVTEDMLALPPKFRLLEVTPKRVRVDLDQRGQTQLVVAAPAGAGFTSGKPAAGLVVKSIVVEPQSLTLTGPQSALTALKEAEIRPVSVEGLGIGRHELETGLADRLLEKGVTTASTVRMTVEIEEEPQEAVFSVRVTLLLTPDYGRDFDAESAVKEATVSVRGPAGAINELKARPELLMAVVDVAAMREADSQPVDATPLISTQPLQWQFRPGFTGARVVTVAFKSPEKPETELTCRRRAK